MGVDPIPGTDRVDILALDVIRAARITMQQSLQILEIEMRCQQILATEIYDRAMPRLAGVVAIGFDFTGSALQTAASTLTRVSKLRYSLMC